MKPVTLHIVFDNLPYRPDLTALWGFAALLELPEHSLLFDTGSNGRVLLKNMAAMELDPGALDLVFLSHPHWDHMGGLDSLLEVNPRVRVVLHEGFSKHLVRDLERLCAEVVVVGAEPARLLPGVWSTGLIDGDPPEQALLFETPSDLAVVSGCAHPGMVSVVRQAARIIGRPPGWAIGGFHLMYQDAAAIEQTVDGLRALGVKRVVPTHCSGDLARAGFRRAYAEGCIEGGVGRRIPLV